MTLQSGQSLLPGIFLRISPNSSYFDISGSLVMLYLSTYPGLDFQPKYQAIKSFTLIRVVDIMK